MSAVQGFPSQETFYVYSESNRSSELDLTTITTKDYLLEGKIGEGGLAKVFQAKTVGENYPCALKIIKKRKNNWTIEDEYSILKYLASSGGSERVIKVQNLLQRESYLALELPLAKCSLRQCIRYEIKITPEILRKMVYQILEGLAYLESKEIIHADISPGNLLVFGPGNVTISDFGGAFSIDDKRSDGNTFNALKYIPPEGVLETGEHGYEADVWSAACSIAELVIRRGLFGSINPVTDPFDQYKEFRGDLFRAHEAKLGPYPESLKERAKQRGVYLLHPQKIEDETLRTRQADCYKVSSIEGREDILYSVGVDYRCRYGDEGALPEEFDALMKEMLQMDPLNRPLASSLLESAFFQEQKADSVGRTEVAVTITGEDEKA